MRTELCKARTATSEKLRNEWDKRLDLNSQAVDRIQENRDLWLRAGGPDPDKLAAPSESLVEDAKRTSEVLTRMLETHGPSGGMDSYVETLQNSVRMLKAVSWSAIKADRFSLTPDALYNELVRNAQTLLSSWSGDYTRRQARMRAPLEQDDVPAEQPKANEGAGSLREPDCYGLVKCLDAERARAMVWRIMCVALALAQNTLGHRQRVPPQLSQAPYRLGGYSENRK